jgi:hypothetical protein
MVYLMAEMGVNRQSAMVDKEKLQNLFDASDIQNEFPDTKIVADIIPIKNTLIYTEEHSITL